MHYFSVVIISIFLLAQPGFAQLNEENDSLENKKPTFNFSNDANYLNRIDSFEPQIFYNIESKIFTLYKPDFNLIRNKLTYSI